MAETSIQWTDRTINPIRARDPKTGAVGHYCEMFSAGCAHCYASTFQNRFKMPAFPGKPREPSLNRLTGDVVRIRGLDVFLDESKLQEVLRRKDPTKYFWCDMTDMFGSWVPEEWLHRCFAVMEQSQQHVHQVLTKRAERMCDYLSWRWGPRDDGQGSRIPARNVWTGVSVENQRELDHRLSCLGVTPSATRFVSAEPLLEGLNFAMRTDGTGSALTEAGIDWVIIGGESGPQARPYNVAWARSIIGQCRAAGVSVFHKQLGSHVVSANDTVAEWFGECGHLDMAGEPRFQGEVERVVGFTDRKGGDTDEWPEDLRVREFPAVDHATANA